MRRVSTNRSRLPRWDEMLQVVAPYVAEMLHLKPLTINRVAGVAGFQTMSTCESHIKLLIINMVAGILLVFEHVIIAHLEFLHGFPLVAPSYRAVARRRRKRSDGEPKSEQVRVGQTFENLVSYLRLHRANFDLDMQVAGGSILINDYDPGLI
jgi:hypothetical protein